MRIELLGLIACAAAYGCGDDDATCGAMQPASASAPLITISGQMFTSTGYTASLNNDCNPEQPISYTIGDSDQTAPAAMPNRGITVCVPDPGRIAGAAVPLDDATRVVLVGVSAADASCVYGQDFTAAPSGTVTFDGFCTTPGTVFNLSFEGTVAGTRTCAPNPAEPVTLMLSGTVAVTVL